MIVRSKAPFRLGLAGGGTDVSPYSEDYGGAILNATIDLFANSTIIPNDSGKIVFRSIDSGIVLEYDSAAFIEPEGKLILQKGIYNRIVKDFVKKPLSFELVTSMDVSTGSGLGTSSTMVVSMLGAFIEWLNLPLGEYDIAHLAYQIEREDLQMAGGKQDQYAATFGGVNFMEFYAGDKVIVNPLRIRQDLLNELEHNLLLYYTKTNRESSRIIDEQASNVKKKNAQSVEAMHRVKEQAFRMKEAVLKGNVDQIGEILHHSWMNKKQMASGISNPFIDGLYDKALEAGATGGKISGAGGGGFMTFYCPGNTRHNVAKVLNEMGGVVTNYHFNQLGLTQWISNPS